MGMICSADDTRTSYYGCYSSSPPTRQLVSKMKPNVYESRNAYSYLEVDRLNSQWKRLLPTILFTKLGKKIVLRAKRIPKHTFSNEQLRSVMREIRREKSTSETKFHPISARMRALRLIDRECETRKDSHDVRIHLDDIVANERIRV